MGHRRSRAPPAGGRHLHLADGAPSRAAGREASWPVRSKKKLLALPAGWPVDRFSVVTDGWAGETVVCIGGGPSVTPEAVALARGRARVVAINNAYLLAPWADVLYFADYRWWEWHRGRKEFQQFAGEKVSIQNTGGLIADAGIHILHNYQTEGLSVIPNGVHTGANGGYQVINMVALSRPKLILLLGYDMKYTAGKSHWHGGHPVKVHEDSYRRWAKLFDTMLPQLDKWGVKVVNCCADSLITAFPKGDLASLLPDTPAAVV